MSFFPSFTGTAYDQVVGLIRRDVMMSLDPSTIADPLQSNPSAIFDAIGAEADPWQKEVLDCNDLRMLLCCSRQAGKSQTAAAMALREAICNPPAEVLIISKALRQSAELLRKVKELHRGLLGNLPTRKKDRISKPPLPYFKWLKREELYDQKFEAYRERRKADERALSMDFANGSRIISLPGKADTIVGFSAIDLLIIDEAARTGDDLYRSVRPMLAVSKGRLLALSTPFGKRGWFWEEWKRCEDYKREGKKPAWKQFQIRADQCPRIDKEFLKEEFFSIGERWYAQEYCCEFRDTVDSVFSYDDIQATIDDEIEPLIL